MALEGLRDGRPLSRHLSRRSSVMVRTLSSFECAKILTELRHSQPTRTRRLPPFIRLDVFLGLTDGIPAAHAMPTLSDVVGLTLILSTYIVIHSLVKSARKRRGPLPPGPRPLPLVGNLFDLPKTTPWVTYRDWSNKYGTLFFICRAQHP